MQLLDRFRSLRGSFVLVPGLFILAGIILAQILILVDRAYFPAYLSTLESIGMSVGADGAHGVLTTIATSVLLAATIAFFATISIMSSARSSWGPRVIADVMTDRANRIVLGIFTATFMYCIVVLRSVHGSSGVGPQSAFVPVIGVHGAVFLALINTLVLVYFIHHIASGIQVRSIAKDVQRTFASQIEKSFHRDASWGEVSFTSVGEDFDRHYRYPVHSSTHGYILTIDHAVLALNIAGDRYRIRVECAAGDHLIAGEKIATISSDRELTPKQVTMARNYVLSAVSMGARRNAHDDIRYSAQQLVELGMRALSPGTNDPYSLTDAIRDLTGGLVRAAQARHVARTVTIRGEATVHMKQITPADLIDLVFDDLRPVVSSHPLATRELLTMAGKIFTLGTDPDSLARARWHAALLLRECTAHMSSTEDARTLNAVFSDYFGPSTQPSTALDV